MHKDESDILFDHGALEDFMRSKHGLAIEPLVLDMNNIKTVCSQVTVTLPGQRDYDMPFKGPTQNPGHRLTVTIPFTGNAQLWFKRPAGIGDMGLQPRGVVDPEQMRLTLSFEDTEDPTKNPNFYVRKQQAMLDRIKSILIYQADALARHL